MRRPSPWPLEWNRANVSSLAQKSGDDPVLLSQSHRIDAEREQFAAGESVSDEYGRDRVTSLTTN